MHVKFQSETINITPKIQILLLDMETLQLFLPLLSLMWYKENYISLYSINGEVLCKYFIIRFAAVSNMLNFVKKMSLKLYESISKFLNIPAVSLSRVRISQIHIRCSVIVVVGLLLEHHRLSQSKCISNVFQAEVHLGGADDIPSAMPLELYHDKHTHNNNNNNNDNTQHSTPESDQTECFRMLVEFSSNSLTYCT